MIITLTFLSVLLIILRIYSIFSMSLPKKCKSYFTFRVTIFTLFFEILTILFYSFFSSLKFLLPPLLMVIEASDFNFNIFENISILTMIYLFVNFILIITFYIPLSVINITNKYIIIFNFSLNVILGLILLF